MTYITNIHLMQARNAKCQAGKHKEHTEHSFTKHPFIKLKHYDLWIQASNTQANDWTRLPNCFKSYLNTKD